MGKLVKNHWARLIVLVAALYQVLAGVHGIFWPKLFWDFLTTNLDRAVRPIPILQIINIVLGATALALEWPLPIFVTASSAKRLADARRRQQNHQHSASTASQAANSPMPSRFYTLLGALHGSIEARLLIYPLNTLAALLLYQGTNSGLYYLIGMGVYFWAFTEGEMVMGVPWHLPRRRSSGGVMKV